MSDQDLRIRLDGLAALGVIQEDVESGLVYGTTYVRKAGHNGKGVLLVHGQSGNRYGLAVLSHELALEGYFCLSIDLPSHYKNPNPLRISVLSETIMEAVALLEQRYGLQHISVIGHSIGAVGALFASAGYTTHAEEQLYRTGDKLIALMQQETTLLDKGIAAGTADELKVIHTKIESAYNELKEIAFGAMKQGLTMRLNVRGYVFLAPPRRTKAAYPAVGLLTKLNRTWLKRVAEFVLHRPAIAVVMKEGNVARYEPEKDPAYINMQFFKTKEVYEFLEYIMAVKEPIDFIGLLEAITRLKRKEEHTNLIQYYYEKYIGGAPKLFIYGKYDMLLRPFMPGERKRLERFYQSCKNAEVWYGSFSHIMVDEPKQQLSSVAVRNSEVIDRIRRFLRKNLLTAR